MKSRKREDAETGSSDMRAPVCPMDPTWNRICVSISSLCVVGHQEIRQSRRLRSCVCYPVVSIHGKDLLKRFDVTVGKYSFCINKR